MARSKSNFSGVPRTGKRDPTQDALTENIEVLTGQRGDKLNRALLYRDLVNLNELTRQALIASTKSGNNNNIGAPIIGGGIESPHAPVNLQSVGGFTFIAITWDAPTYQGHAYAEIWRGETNVFGDAVRVSTEVSNTYSDSVNMGSAYYYWVRFVNVAGQLGPIHNANGLYVETLLSADAILAEVEGRIESTHLGSFLTTEVGRIPNISDHVDQLLLDMPQLLIDVPQLMIDVPQLLVDIENPLGSSIGADLVNNYSTTTTANAATALAITALKAIVEDPSGSSLGATLVTNYRTTANSDIVIASAISALKTIIEDPSGSSIGADLVTNYYTTIAADLATAAAILALKTAIEDPSGSSIGANLTTNHYTKTSADLATSSAITTLKTAIEDPSGSSVGADLVTNHYTKTNADLAIAAAITILKSTIEDPSGSSVGATLYTDYRTEAATNNAITNATTAMQTAIENPSGSGLGATLENNYRTEVDTNTAISTANTILQSLIEDANGVSVGASLQTLSETVATGDGEFSALWGVKTTVAQLTASFGLLNDGVDPIFAIKGAKFAVITNQDPTVLTPVFSVVDGKTVMKSALIDEAHIQTLVTDDLLSNRIVVGSELNTPSINYNRTTGERTQNFSVDPSGNVLAKSATLESVTIKDANGNVVMSSTGAVPNTQITGLGTLVQGYADTAEQNAKDYADGEFIDSVTYGNELAELQSQIDGNITTWFLSGVPTLANAPRNTWTTTALKNQHLSDIYYDDATGFAYRFKLVSTTYSWQKIDDSDITKALSDASKAQDTADGKRRVFVAQPIPPYDIGDLWDTGSGFNRCKAVKLIGGNYSSGDWQLGADTTNYNDTRVSNTLEENGTLSISRPIGGSFSGGSVNTGMIKITLPQSWSSTMMRFFVDVYVYSTNKSFTLEVGGYNYPGSGGRWLNHFARISGDVSGDNRVRLGHDGSKCAIYIGETGSSWPHVKVTVRDFQAGFTNYTKSQWGDNWVVGVTATLGAITKDYADALLDAKSIQGQGALATQNSLAYNSLTSKPTLGNLAALNTLAYNSLTSKPTLGSLAALNSLGYNALTGKPTLGALAALNSITYSSVTGKPTLGPFAGLTKILKSNVTTYIQSGAIGSAQIDQAYIDTLFGNNASFSGTVYAQNIEGDVTDTLVKTTTPKTNNHAKDIATFNVSALPFDRTFSIDSGIEISGDSGPHPTAQDSLRLYKDGVMVWSQFIIPQSGSPSISRTMVSTVEAGTSAEFVVRIELSITGCQAQPIIAHVFKRGSTLS